MPNKKLTDNEVVKALECVASDKDVLCKGCSYNKYYLNQCHKENAKDAIALINRQKAEIERLEKESSEFAKRFYKDGVKEFAERLKGKAVTHNCRFKGVVYDIAAVKVEEIDNLVKEMVGDA